MFKETLCMYNSREGMEIEKQSKSEAWGEKRKKKTRTLKVKG